MGGRSKRLLALGAAVVLAMPAQASRRDATLSITLHAGRLDEALRTLSIASGTGLLFPPDLVGDRRSPRVSATGHLETILDRLLAGSGLAYRRTGAGTIILYPAPPATTPPAIPEILVIGRKTQNEDIRRTENDVQRYQILDPATIAASQADNLDQVLRSRAPADATRRSAAQNPIGTLAGSRSEIDLYGLGANQTLVLIDGARMPGIASLIPFSTYQPDLNAVPLRAIERIELLAATASGIYGPGATGGVVNIILKRDYRGADVALSYGLTDRGDAPTRRIDGRIGFTPDGGRTDVMIAFSHAATAGLRLGDRSYAVRARQIAIDRDPIGFLQQLPAVDGLLVRSLSGGDLSLKPALGGTALGSIVSFLPTGYAGIASDGGAALIANAGQIPATLSHDARGTQQSLTSDTRIDSVLLNLRHHLGDDIEGFVDLIGLRNQGRALTAANVGYALLFGTTASNPFAQNVLVTFPLPGFEIRLRNQVRTIRLSAGAIARLSPRWQAEGRFSAGWVRNRIAIDGSSLNDGFILATALGQPGTGGEPVADPFGSWSRFVAALQAYRTPLAGHFTGRLRFSDASLRLAGPIVDREAGSVSLSLLAERRRETTLASPSSQTVSGATRLGTSAGFAQAVSSLYGELRVPIAPREAAASPVRGLELQLAARHDRFGTRLPRIAQGTATADDYRLFHSGTAYTLGLRAFPVDRLMLRASIATGSLLLPTPTQIASGAALLPVPAADPKRGGRPTGSEGPYTVLLGGSPRLKPAHARTLALGAVLNPERPGRLRVTLDYSHIVLRDEIVASPTYRYLLANEDRYPDRIERMPLTPADIAQGFTGGIVTRIDATAFNAGSTVADIVELRAAYPIPDGAGGTVTLHADAIWQPRLKRIRVLDGPAVNLVGYADGPLRWRGNIGADWTHRRLTIAVDGQYHGGYRAIDAPSAALDEVDLPGTDIPPTFYVDLAIAYRFDAPAATPLRDPELRFGISNLFDRAPPILASSDFSAGYSYDGDPRGRRFALTLSAHF